MSNEKKDYNKIEVTDTPISREDDILDTSGREKLDKVVSTEPVKKKKNLASRFVSGVLGPEGLPGIGSFVSEEIIIPAIKNIIVDAVTSGINMIMYGDNNHRSRNHTDYNRRSSSSIRPVTNYTSRYTNLQPQPNTNKRVRTGGRYVVDDFVITDRNEAANVISILVEHADRYGSVSVADYYDLIGTHTEYTDNNYGWTLDNIVNASIIPVQGGYMIRFPAVEVL